MTNINKKHDPRNEKKKKNPCRGETPILRLDTH